LKNEREELSCILLGYEHGLGSEEYTACCNRKERNSVVWMKEELQKLKGFESGMDNGVTFLLEHIRSYNTHP
jgi:hypothetical protein